MPTNNSEQGGPPAPAHSAPAHSAPAHSAPEPAPVAAHDPPQPRKTFWQRRFVQNVLPAATSVLLHAGILLLGYATFQVVKTATTRERVQIIIPEAEIVEGAAVGGVPNPGLGTDPNIVSNLKVDLQEQTRKLAEKSASIASSIGGEAASEGVIGIGAGSAGGAVALRSGVGRGGAGAGADLAGTSPFGVPGGSGGMAPKSPFMGVSGNAYRVVYLVDASGTMLNVQTPLKRYLCEAVDVLKPVQFFNIFFFTSKANTGFESYKTRLVPATPVNKVGAISSEKGWIAQNYEAYGDGDPMPALRAAMAQEPELIYLLTDGFEEAKSDAGLAIRVRDEIRRLNADKKVHISTILIRGRRDTVGAQKLSDGQTEELKAVLKQIAEENRGRYKVADID